MKPIYNFFVSNHEANNTHPWFFSYNSLSNLLEICGFSIIAHNRYYDENDLIILESTSPVGTTEKIHKLILENTELKFDQIHIAYCPERVLPGNIFSELRKNDRVIDGITNLLGMDWCVFSA